MTDENHSEMTKYEVSILFCHRLAEHSGLIVHLYSCICDVVMFCESRKNQTNEMNEMKQESDMKGPKEPCVMRVDVAHHVRSIFAAFSATRGPETDTCTV